jgi:hypothetical protein
VDEIEGVRFEGPRLLSVVDFEFAALGVSGESVCWVLMVGLTNSVEPSLAG